MDDDSPEIIEQQPVAQEATGQEQEQRQPSDEGDKVQEISHKESTDDDDNNEPSSQGDGESNSTCMICMEDWTLTSAHRICCLKCGHLFGRSCIERWVREKGVHARCPTCQEKTKKGDIRNIWCRTVKARVGTDITELQAQLEFERRAHKADVATLYSYKYRIEMAEKDCANLKRENLHLKDKVKKLESVVIKLNALRQQNVSSADGSTDIIDFESIGMDSTNIAIDMEVRAEQIKGKFHPAEKLECSPIGGCKTFTICPTSQVILVAQPTPAGTPNVFGNYGLRRYSIIDTNLRSDFIPLHSKIITSIQLKEYGGLVLSASQDKKVKLTNINSNACIQTYNCTLMPTCVTWSTHRDQQFYVGFGNCFVALYDTRNTSDHIYLTNQRIANTRLLSIASVSGAENLNGVLANDSRGSQFLEISDESAYDSQFIDQSLDHLKVHQLPFDGTMGTVDYHKKTNLALITTRHSQANPNATHNLVKLSRKTSEEGVHSVECNNVRTFIGGRSADLLSQSRILRHPTQEDGVLVAACDDTARGIKIWDATDDTVFQSIQTGVFVRDMICYTPENSNNHQLYALSDKGLSIYKWDWA